MPTVEKVRGGSVYIRPLDRDFEIGDRAGVGEDMAAYLCEVRGDFDLADGESEEGDAGDDFGVNGWLENDYQDRADAVLAGGLDDYLDEIEAAETSETVLDAVDERRDELEEA